MTADAFIKAVEAYYGPYPREAVKRATARYLTDFAPEQLDMIFRNLLLDFSGQYKHTPDIAVIEGVRKDIGTTIAYSWLERPKRPEIAYTSSDPDLADTMAELLGNLKKKLSSKLGSLPGDPSLTEDREEDRRPL